MSIWWWVMAALLVAAPIVTWAAIPIPTPRRTYSVAMAFLAIILGVPLVPLGLHFGPWIGPVGAVALPLAALFIGIRWRRLSRWLRELDNPYLREGARQRLRAHLARLKTRRRERAWFVSHSFVVADALAQAGMEEEAIEVLEHVPAPSLRYRHERELWRNNLGVYRLKTGDLEGARELLVGLCHEAQPAVRQAARCNEALLLSVQGKGDGALALLGTTPVAKPAHHRRTWLIARAHALASSGDTDGARESLLRLVRDDGQDALQRATRPPGPATSIANALLAESATPYR